MDFGKLESNHRKNSNIFFSIAFFLALIVFVAAPVELRAQDDGVDINATEVTNCAGLKDQRQEFCKVAAKLCVDVYRLEAHNQIQACAYYSQECYQANVLEEKHCGDFHITLNGQ